MSLRLSWSGTPPASHRTCPRHPRIGGVAAQGRVRESVAIASVLLFGRVSQGTFPIVRQLLRHHVLDRQVVTGRRLLPLLGFPSSRTEPRTTSEWHYRRKPSGFGSPSWTASSFGTPTRVFRSLRIRPSQCPAKSSPAPGPGPWASSPTARFIPGVGRSANHNRVVHVPIPARVFASSSFVTSARPFPEASFRSRDVNGR